MACVGIPAVRLHDLVPNAHVPNLPALVVGMTARRDRSLSEFSEFGCLDPFVPVAQAPSPVAVFNAEPIVVIGCAFDSERHHLVIIRARRRPAAVVFVERVELMARDDHNRLVGGACDSRLVLRCETVGVREGNHRQPVQAPLRRIVRRLASLVRLCKSEVEIDARGTLVGDSVHGAVIRNRQRRTVRRVVPADSGLRDDRSRGEAGKRRCAGDGENRLCGIELAEFLKPAFVWYCHDSGSSRQDIVKKNTVLIARLPVCGIGDITITRFVRPDRRNRSRVCVDDDDRSVLLGICAGLLLNATNLVCQDMDRLFVQVERRTVRDGYLLQRSRGRGGDRSSYLQRPLFHDESAPKIDRTCQFACS